MIIVDKFTVTGGYEIYPYNDTRSASLFYGLGTLPANPASSSIGAATDNCIIVVLQKNISDDVLSLHVVLGAPTSTSTGSCSLTVSGLPTTSAVVVSDDSAEFKKIDTTTATGTWSWGSNTDGGAIAPMNDMGTVTITVNSFSGALTTLRFVSANSQYFDTPLSTGLQVTITKSQSTIQSALYLEPGPATYDVQQTVKITMDPGYSSLIHTSDGTAPTLAKYIAYDNLTPPNPFIAVVQDGKGNAVFDGGFPKWYNGASDPSWTAFGQLSGSFKYFGNALNFIANPAKVAAGNKKVLILGDANSGGNYSIKDTTPNGFKTSFDQICGIMGYIPTYKTGSDYAATILDPTYAELDQYACLVVMSSVLTDAQLITNAAVSNIAAFREAGNGVFIITDHGTGSSVGFYKTANFIASNLGVYFEGDYNRVPMNVGYLRQTYGDHPLYANLTDNESIHAGGSESRVFVTPTTTYNQGALPNITTKLNGISTFRFLLQKLDGTIETTSATYAINIQEPVKFVDNSSNIILGVTPTFKRSYDININLNNVSFGTTISGLIKVNSVVVGTFSGTNGVPVYSWTNTTSGNNVTLSETSVIEVEVQNPIQFFKSISVPVAKEPNLPLSLAKLINRINKYDLAETSPFDVIRQAPAKLGLPPSNRLAKEIKDVRTYLS